MGSFRRRMEKVKAISCAAAEELWCELGRSRRWELRIGLVRPRLNLLFDILFVAS